MMVDLEQRRAQLAERKRRLIQLEKIETEEAEILQRIAQLRGCQRGPLHP